MSLLAQDVCQDVLRNFALVADEKGLSRPHRPLVRPHSWLAMVECLIDRQRQQFPFSGTLSCMRSKDGRGCKKDRYSVCVDFVTQMIVRRSSLEPALVGIEHCDFETANPQLKDLICEAAFSFPSRLVPPFAGTHKQAAGKIARSGDAYEKNKSSIVKQNYYARTSNRWCMHLLCKVHYY